MLAQKPEVNHVEPRCRADAYKEGNADPDRNHLDSQDEHD
jgi:hypothetical protein